MGILALAALLPGCADDSPTRLHSVIRSRRTGAGTTVAGAGSGTNYFSGAGFDTNKLQGTALSAPGGAVNAVPGTATSPTGLTPSLPPSGSAPARPSATGAGTTSGLGGTSSGTGTGSTTTPASGQPGTGLTS